MVPSRPLQPGRHDAGAGAGHDHPVGRGQPGGQVAGLDVDRVVGPRAGRAEDGDLADVAVGAEDPEGLGHLGQGRVGDLQVDDRRCPRAARSPSDADHGRSSSRRLGRRERRGSSNERRSKARLAGAAAAVLDPVGHVAARAAGAGHAP